MMCIIEHVLINYAKIQKKTEKKEVSFTNTLLNPQKMQKNLIIMRNLYKIYNTRSSASTCERIVQEINQFKNDVHN